MIRNQPLLWVLSIGFELMELTFRHMLPNFNECWWDSIVLDILICNWFGIWAGMKTVRYFDGRTYEWVGLSRQPNIISKVCSLDVKGNEVAQQSIWWHYTFLFFGICPIFMQCIVLYILP
jgi:phosphatidylserine synthase 2